MERRIAISGIGVITPVGIGKDAFWHSIIHGISNVNKIKDPEIQDLKFDRGLVIENFDFSQIMNHCEKSKIGRGSQLAIAATKLALEDSFIDLQNINPKRIGISLGTTLGESQAIEEATRQKSPEPEESRTKSGSFRGCSPTNIVMSVAEHFQCEGPILLIPTACSAGNYAVSYAFDQIRAGRTDTMIAGGVEPFSKILHIGFARMNLLAPEKCQPFDMNRKGLLVSEGAGILILEDMEHALKRSAEIYGEILGYGLSCDAFHAASPEPEGRGAAEALQRALRMAKLNPDEIHYISAHGTGTKANDLIETKAVKKVFGSVAKKIPISSIKSMIGHTMGAAGAIEAALCALILQHQIIPPTMNYTEPDPLCDLDYVPNSARNISVAKIMSNAYGFFGNNGSVVFSKI